MSMFQIDASVIMNVAREYALAGNFEFAEKTLKESLVGIDDVSISKLLNGTHILVNKEFGMDLIESVDHDYIRFLNYTKEKLRSDDNFKDEVRHEKLLKIYQRQNFEFIFHELNERIVNLPVALVNSAIDNKAPPLDFENLDAIEQISLLLENNEKENKKAKELISEIKTFGFQFFNKFHLFRENKAFGRFTGKVKTLEDKASLKDTDILFLDVQRDISLTRYHSAIEKVCAVVAYRSMRSLLAHHDIFQKSKEQYDQIPLLLVDIMNRNMFLELRNKDITIDLRRNIMSKK